MAAESGIVGQETSALIRREDGSNEWKPKPDKNDADLIGKMQPPRVAKVIEDLMLEPEYKLSACLNVMATGHKKDYQAPGKYIGGSDRGDFALWNELKARGHEVMPDRKSNAPHWRF